MNISTGGPHLLLFERDQQLTALLNSEFQLAGYECHTARTAVEVFDAIARYPIRLVLVNLAQAAAARREFWVALDTQRRGRGVQVLTFLCYNLASYGPQDTSEERSQTVHADMEIDGMLGLMAMVEAVRQRVPGSGASSTLPRVSRVSPSSAGMPSSSSSIQTPLAQPSSSSTTLSGGAIAASGTTYRAGYQETGGGSFAGQSQATAAQAQRKLATAVPPSAPKTDGSTVSAGASPQPASYTDKIRAVLYPNQRAWSSQSSIPASQDIIHPNSNAQSVIASPISPVQTETTALQRLAGRQGSTQENRESSLAQLSRLLQERQAATTGDVAREPVARGHLAGAPIASAPTTSTQHIVTPVRTPIIEPAPTAEVSTEPASVQVPHLAASPAASLSHVIEQISAQPLRASPIQDIPADHMGSSEDQKRPEVRGPYGQGSSTTPTPLASIASAPPVSTPNALSSSSAAMVASEMSVDESEGDIGDLTGASEFEDVSERYQQQDEQGGVLTATEPQEAVRQHQLPRDVPAPIETSEVQDIDVNIPSRNGILLDIVQSFPAMPSPPPQPQVLKGRATRSLGSVLLEGHLVQQNRLEVAQNIQRMLRGVDLNYQLGEILLMFKLLTPDQLLAASLVSYGLITPAQISALGRIRQELHSIGLEYDLENLLILFRILSPEQLREVRLSWQS